MCPSFRITDQVRHRLCGAEIWNPGILVEKLDSGLRGCVIIVFLVVKYVSVPHSVIPDEAERRSGIQRPC